MARFLVQAQWIQEVSSDWIAAQGLVGEQVQVWLKHNVTSNLCPEKLEQEQKEFHCSVLPIPVSEEVTDG